MRKGSIIRKASPVRFVRSGPVASAQLSYSERCRRKLLVGSLVLPCSGSHVPLRTRRGNVLVPSCATFLPCCCRNVTAESRRCDTFTAVLTACIGRSHGSGRGFAGGSRNEPALPAADLFVRLGH